MSMYIIRSASLKSHRVLSLWLFILLNEILEESFQFHFNALVETICDVCFIKKNLFSSLSQKRSIVSSYVLYETKITINTKIKIESQGDKTLTLKVIYFFILLGAFCVLY